MDCALWEVLSEISDLFTIKLHLQQVTNWYQLYQNNADLCATVGMLLIYIDKYFM